MAAYGFEFRGYRFAFSDDENTVDIYLGDVKQTTLTSTVGRVEWSGDVAVEVGGESALHKAMTWACVELRKAKEPKTADPVPTEQPTEPIKAKGSK